MKLPIKLIIFAIVFITLSGNALASDKSNWEFSFQGSYLRTLNEPVNFSEQGIHKYGYGINASLYWWFHDRLALNFGLFGLDDFMGGTDKSFHLRVLVPLLSAPLGIHYKMFETQRFAFGIEGGGSFPFAMAAFGGRTFPPSGYCYGQLSADYKINESLSLNIVPRYQTIFMSYDDGYGTDRLLSLHYLSIGIGFKYRF
ncbi:hypothetical protein KKA47_03855 [bacterium]|nr:hypothetical protein [bacterium]MCG2690579.1 hypothetical protein [Candidatus Parcubacteria bacterium]